MRRQGRTATAALVAAVLALFALAALASTGSGLLLPGAELSAEAGWIVRLVGGGLAATGITALVARGGGRAHVGGRALLPALVTAGAVMVLLTLATAPVSDLGEGTTDDGLAPPPAGMVEDVGEDGPPPRGGDGDATIDPLEGADPVLVYLTLALLLLGLGAFVAALRELAWIPQRAFRRRAAGRPHLPADLGLTTTDPALVRGGLAASLDATRSAPTARDAITAAYAALLDALTRAGGGRRRHEAPHEHLRRVLTSVGVRAGPAHHLAALFVLARFGHHPVTEDQRATAVAALQACLDDLHVEAGPDRVEAVAGRS